MCFLYKSKEFGIEGNGISLGTKKPPPISCAYLTSWKAQYMINSQKKKKGKDPKGLLDISQAKHVWVSDLKWFSLQLGHAWHTQQESWLSPCAVKTDDRGVGLLEGFQRVPYIPILSCLERNFAFSSSLLLSIALDTVWFLCSFMAFGKRFLMAYPWIILLPLQITYGFCFQQVECQLHESAKWALLNITLKFKWERREVRGGGFQDASLFTNESSRWLGKLCSSWVKFGIAHAKSVFVFIQLV